MSDGEIAEPLRGGLSHVVPFPAPAPRQVSFNRAELREILDRQQLPLGRWPAAEDENG